MLLLLFYLFTSFSDDIFWQKKEVYQKIIEKEIIVSASINEKEKLEHLHLVSAGHIAASLAFVKINIMDFTNYDQITDHFQNIKHQENENKLYIEVGAFNYYAALWIDYKLNRKAEDHYHLDWQVVKGSFKGLKGYLNLKAYKSNITEISMQANMSAEKIPIPSALLKIGLEFLGKQMAKKMCSYIEKKYRTTDFFEE